MAASKNTFTATQVGALIESLRHEIQLVAEGMADIHKEVGGLKGWRTNVDAWRTGVDDQLTFIRGELRSVRVDLKPFDDRLKVAEANVG